MSHGGPVLVRRVDLTTPCRSAARIGSSGPAQARGRFPSTRCPALRARAAQAQTFGRDLRDEALPFSDALDLVAIASTGCSGGRDVARCRILGAGAGCGFTRHTRFAMAVISSTKRIANTNDTPTTMSGSALLRSVAGN